METKTRFTPETAQVYPIDGEKLNEDINRQFHKEGEHPDNITFHTNGTLALLRHPKLCIIDDEFVGHDIFDKVIFYVYKEERHPNGGFTGHWFPSYEVSMSLTDLEPYLKPAVSLAEFTKGRRGHNSRIQANEAQWVKYLNK